MLATWSPVPGGRPGAPPPPGSPTGEKAATTLYLVAPGGGRYPITTFPPPGQQASPELVDWSGDGGHALFEAQYATPPKAIEVDLHTGKQTTLPVQGAPRYSRPNGKALLLSVPPGPDSKLATLDRVDLAGQHELTYPTDKLGSAFNGNYLSTPDGMRLVLGTSAGLALMGNDGTPGPTLPIPDQTNCSPLRWWDGSTLATVLAACDAPGFTSRLWLVPVDGGPPTGLTAVNDGQKGPDLRDVSAWQLPAGTFVQAEGACGYQFLAKLNADGTTSPVSVSGVESGRSVIVAGFNGADLDLQATASCGGGQSLFDYSPGTNTSTVLLGPPLNGGGVIKAVPFAGQR
jgi:TolB protein